ncbi:hypothetical protein HOP50_01g05210 [Chloropicon primus]|uniref:Uncharacterized protein n=1 Tax=Chloropicon primus TaxID=1764295 RepID=A0A5B8MED0_9CHLO|nr:hypothetical protein A3770_01p05330 [Chloropicon primus]UPQ97230.1 hypothetical protein HOP50_01g05210 [Chloropicon primus]|mmetsp:Transcript_5959/g.17904  ORF Transcript_5959/g.17904 Transcript_5959/m.17904 type:complete len:125 (+) Transcript_5959:50-424(+)|eukprot:QDZ18015.1 hypothetical protein A3770_01p05330 [Chloropicon primus]
MPTVYQRSGREENERLRDQLEQVKQSCLLLNHKVEGNESVLSKQREIIVQLKQQLKSQEVRHAKELRELSDAHSQVLKNFVQKHCIQVSGLEKKVRSLQKIMHTSFQRPEGEESDEVPDKENAP